MKKKKKKKGGGGGGGGGGVEQQSASSCFNPVCGGCTASVIYVAFSYTSSTIFMHTVCY